MRLAYLMRLTAALAALTLGACGGDDDGGSSGGGTGTTSGVGAAGGTVAGPNGAQVVVPAGALAQNTPIVVAQSSAGAPALPSGVTAAGQIYAFTPHGTTFASPVAVTIPFDPALVPVGATAQLYKTNAAQSGWEVVANAAASGSSMSGQISSFSYLVAAYQHPELEVPPSRVYRFTRWQANDLPSLLADVNADAGAVFAQRDFGPLTIAPTGHDLTATGEVYSNATGRTYWVEAEAPIGDVNTPTDFIGGESWLWQFQAYRKRDANATLRMVISEAWLEAIDNNGADPVFQECPWAPGTGPADVCLDEVFGEIDLSIAVVKLLPGELEVHSAHQGYLRLWGWQENWEWKPSADGAFFYTYHGVNDGPTGSTTLINAVTPIFDESQFDFTVSNGAASQTDASVRLRGDIPIEVDISSIPEGSMFFVETVLKVDTNNRRGRESFVAARLRDPVQSNGLGWETTGLQSVAPPDDIPESITYAQPECTAASSGALQFSEAAYSLPEFRSGRSLLVTRTGGSEGLAMARISTSDGTAVAGTHYDAVDHLIVFGDGDDTPRSIDIPITNDDAYSGPNTINVTLSGVGCGAIGAQDEAVVTILDDETPAASAYTVGGTVNGLVGSGLVLEDRITGANGVPSNGSFTIDYRYPNGGSYDVRVLSQPTNPVQSCTVANAAGTIAAMNVTNVVVTCAAVAPSGSLDLTFSQDGRVIADLTSSAGARSIALQSDGKILAVGGLQLLRFNADGSPDATFGANGIAPIVLGTGGEAFAVAQQVDGRIVVAGHTRVGLQDDFAIARFNADGSPDTGFGASGRTVVPVYVDADLTGGGRMVGGNDRAYRVLPLADGDILIAGHGGFTAYDDHGTPVGGGNSYAVVRLNADGSIDTGFNTTGRATLAPNGVDAALAYGAAVQADGAIVIGGKYANATSESDLGLVRFNANGSLDQTFGPSDFGYSTQDLYGFNEEIKDLVVMPDGRIVVAALAVASASPNPVAQFTIVSFTGDGAMLALRSTPIGSGDETTSALAAQSDGKFILVGASRDANGLNPNFGVVRYNSDLTVDTSFGANGIVTVDFFGSTDVANDVLVQPDGRIIVGGVVRNGSSWDLGLIRVQP